MSYFDGELKIEVSGATGTEAVIKRELVSLGYSAGGAENGRICFDGDMLGVARANMFLRSAGRVRIVLAKFSATSFDELFENTVLIPWGKILPKDAKIAVTAKSVKSALFALPPVQSVVKKAIINTLSAVYGKKTFSEDGAEYGIEVSIFEDKVTLALDTSGAPLHKRGYRTYLGEAPIRETLASSIIELSVWKAERTLIDPFCGSGTIPIEAAMIACKIAPGLRRKFAYEDFDFAPAVRAKVQEEAQQLVDMTVPLKISAFDINPEAVKLALYHAERAGVKDKLHIQVQDMRKLSSSKSHGVIITNPPYGERLMQERELRQLYTDFGNVFRTLDEWCAYVITSYKGFEKYFAKRADRTRKLFNSELECFLYQYLGAKPPARNQPKEV
jgi:putative N6-adenine-specific DNA methylase